jgi:tRNA (mo5U34)-methyltransferase
MTVTSHESGPRVPILGQWFQSRDLTGKSVLDVGCNAGFYSIEMKKRGAARVVGIDSDDLSLRRARLAADVSGFPDIEFRNMSVYDVASLGERFDLVLFMGMLYQLRHPLLALDLLYEKVVADILIFQGMDGDRRRATHAADGPVMYLVDRRSGSEPTNWWVPNRACAEALLRSAGFAIEANPEEEVYICRRGAPDA